jgi:hypothetical protein
MIVYKEEQSEGIVDWLFMLYTAKSKVGRMPSTFYSSPQLKLGTKHVKGLILVNLCIVNWDFWIMRIKLIDVGFMDESQPIPMVVMLSYK